MAQEPVTLGDLIERRLTSIQLGTRTTAALGIARSQHIHHLPVFSGSTLVGLVCTCDLAQASLDSCVDDCMTQPAVTLDAHATSSDAVRAMSRLGIGSVIVTFDDLACGIITRADLLAAEPELAPSLPRARCELCGQGRRVPEGAAAHGGCAQGSSAAAPAACRPAQHPHE